MRSLYLVPFALVACTSSSPDYGPPTSSTAISLTRSGGFAPPGTNEQSVAIVGSNVTFMSSGMTEQATIETADVAAIIDAMQQIDFLDLKGDYSTCATPATDAPDAHFVVTLDAGSNDLSFYTGCSGGVFDDLQKLEQTIFDRSGFSAWVASH
ncbi:MAG: hypothetical protein QM831_03085 [Kofleriaceae bacterium]